MGISHRFLSPAKINLFLKVLRKREDGYHDIFSLMQPISLYDEIVLKMEDGEGIVVECNNKNIPCGKTNLAYRAAEAFFNAAGIQKKLTIQIRKNIPVAAGLGGGSSNAASVLMGLNKTTSSKLSKDELMAIGAELGSDVPFFIFGNSAIAAGRGERLEKIEIPQFWHVLINPGFPVSTAWVYKNLDLTKANEDININPLKVLWNFPDTLQIFLANDLEAVAIKKYPEIKDIKQSLIDSGAVGALMSGSGPTVFGVFGNEDKAVEAFGLLKAVFEQKRYAVFLAQGIK